MEIPVDLQNYIKSFLPPHPMTKEIASWTRRTYFNRWFFEKKSSRDKIKVIGRFVEHNNFWIKMSELSNKDAVQLKHKCNLDKKRMKAKLQELNLKPYQIRTVTHIPHLNRHGNYSELFCGNNEIIY